ncbi:uncharacterized protein OCT59_029090 [Rhizophagus irregularis]|uniref:F-box domain-containing protein n=1 Tax=Rhizophagus irregularis (strain DAOM 181602 / DAOM 197198 / MUCL 43194) TaxID=747089 RepID=A0A2P4P5A6_RHIID|nr:hypothetical protein GLOIN_2v1787718 [Rhizophagus irregularis DAOM 181602=DAOM 197198]POG60566.1 hypothetical protein GLOIN_2v1787718 [Rhizophagus irregularis DAOM 181602=DAOM 197198]UZO08845.1 hypothetical protein OCT59_029090 [Rhizophagus irregularis]GET54302.1 hypothetical protein GLOIN_2v1787718 [Rhizophagus irregularis DAOM 181602=DAOM 197198]|eukprot:XP_025167432.1 hypothetical protein GLOIN_2v1787718 [Rhizophagus irregularis DAOM 181602=DAOM 197198]
MTCLKIFSGELPELSYEIIKYFQNDYKTLHSSILINRSWCRLAIPLLWENPFLICKYSRKYDFIAIYLHDHFNDKDKLILNRFGINNDVFPSNTLFNYPSFIKSLSVQQVRSSIIYWFTNNKSEYIDTFFGLIYVSLLEVIIKNEACLHTFEFFTYGKLDYFIIKLILKYPNFTHNIRNLELGFDANAGFTDLLKIFTF